MKRRVLAASDVVILSYHAIMAVLIVATWDRQASPALYLGVTGMVAGVTVGLAVLESRRRSALTTFLHAWWPVIAVPLSFKQVAGIAPGVHPFSDHAWDYRLQQMDEWIFGDTRGFFRSIASAPIADVVTLGYWSYFPLALVVGGSLYHRPDLRRFRQATTVLLVGWFLSYLGYYAVPAVGPHLVVDAARAPELDGLLWAGGFHRLLIAMEGTIPDAFPSGHALIAMLVLVLTWPMRRRLFWGILPFCLTLIMATMYLRYHYVVDVLASVVLVPVSVFLGGWLHRKCDPDGVWDPRLSDLTPEIGR